MNWSMKQPTRQVLCPDTPHCGWVHNEPVGRLRYYLYGVRVPYRLGRWALLRSLVEDV